MQNVRAKNMENVFKNNKEASRPHAELLSLVIRTLSAHHADDVWTTYVILQ